MNDDRGRAGGEGRKEVEVETDDGETDGSVRSMRWMRKEDELDGGACGGGRLEKRASRGTRIGPREGLGVRECGDRMMFFAFEREGEIQSRWRELVRGFDASEMRSV